MDTRTAQALIRFGLGPGISPGAGPGISPGAGDAQPADPAEWLLGQLRQPDPLPVQPAPSTAHGLEALRADRQDKPPPGRSRVRALFRAEAAAELAHALATPAPFRERLVWFWTNHFTVSARGGACAAVIGAFIQEAIRPHVTGRFADMLLAAMHHPAMLLYLNNVQSIGPDSRVGLRRHRGLNENLARECMELHTVTPAAGYTQADVTAFAAVLTGWSIDLRADPPGFRYRPFTHEPGEQTVMGRRFPPGEAGGVAALRFLAGHPATHRFRATRLVQHFAADTPPPAAVRAVEAALRDTGGDLGAASAALVRLPAAWQPGTKLRAPQDFLVAVLRLLDLPEARRPNLPGALAGLGQPFGLAPQPNGWPDRAADWAAPEAMIRRIDWAYAMAGRAGAGDPGQLADAALGPLLRPATAQAIRRAPSRREALTLLLTAPEFQRR